MSTVTDPKQKNAIAQFIENVAAGKASLTKAQADLATAIARITELETSQALSTSALATANTALDALQVELATEKAAHSSLLTAHASLCTTLGFKAAEISGKSPAELQAAFSAKISARSTEQLAELGFDATKLPAPERAAAGDAKEMTHAEFSSLTPSAKMNFCLSGGKITGDITGAN